MSRLIDADQFLSDESEAYMSAQNQITDEKLIVLNEIVHRKMQMIIADIPTVDAVPVVHGHWIMKKDFIGTKYECSECGHSDSKTTAIRGHYCWYCGARMDGERKEDGGL